MNRINPPGLSTATGYSHVVEVRAGRTIYVSGQVALDHDGKVVGEGDMAAQATQAFENLKVALAAANATLDHIVKLTVFVTDISQLPGYRAARNQFIPKDLPASSLVQVVHLVRPELLIEIEAVAVVE